MKKLSFLILVSWQLLHADTAGLTVVNAASFLEDSSLAPGAIISIFGSNLASSTVVAGNTANLPHALGGVTVTIRGTSLALFFVAATQINALIDPSVSPGPGTLIVTSTTGVFTKDIVISANSTPGVFSLFGTGVRDGAIENAVTYAIGPYSVTTNGKPTYLSIYTSGLDLSSAPTVTIGGLSVPVQFYGASPCCPGLQQVNVQLTPALAGAGRVAVAVTSGDGETSNITEVVILPNAGQGPFAASGENKARSRELSDIAYIPATSLALVADENDDVLRLIDVSLRAVTRTITLPEGAQPVSVAINQPGVLAVVAERNRGKVALIDLTKYTVTAEVAVGNGPSSVAIAGTIAVVANQESDTVSLVDVYKQQVVQTFSVGRGPSGVAADATANKAYVTSQDDGTLSVIDLNSLLSPPVTITLPANARPASIQLVPTLGVAVIGVPSASSNGQVLITTLSSGTTGTHLVNVDRNGGTSGMAVYANTVFFADQTGGEVTVAPMNSNGGFTSSNVKADLGVRALAVDVSDSLLLAANEGSGTVSLIDWNANKIVGTVDAVKSEFESEGAVPDDHTDRTTAENAPTMATSLPTNASGNTTFTLTITGTNLQGADDVFFVDPTTLPSQVNGSSGNTELGHAGYGVRDTNITVSNIQVTPVGNQLTATVTIANKEPRGVLRVVRVETPNGNTSFVATSVNTFQVD